MRRRVTAGVGAACIAAAVAVTGVAGYNGLFGNSRVHVVAAGPQIVLERSATSMAGSSALIGNGSIRHLRFTNLADEGFPSYDIFVRPDGTALVGKVGEDLHETSGYLTHEQLTGLSPDPDQLRTQMLNLSQQLRLGYPGEAPERALYRLAPKLITDPDVTPAVKAGTYRVLAGLNLEAIRARDLGIGTDRIGRVGFVLEFTFEEGYVDRMVIDSGTGALLSTDTINREGAVVSGEIYDFAEMLDQMPPAHR
ncbi:hypothetical protein [Nocardia tengchongensis]